MINNDYLERILGEQYNMTDYFENTHLEKETENIRKNNNNETANSSINNDKELKEKELKKLYPDIYNVLEPIVELVVRNNSKKTSDDKLVNALTDKIYYAVEATNNDDSTIKSTLSVRNNTRDKKIKNSLLYDLIKILIINNMISNNDKSINNTLDYNYIYSSRDTIPCNINSMQVSNISYNDKPFPEDL